MAGFLWIRVSTSTGGDLEIALQYVESTFDVGEALVALDDVGGTEVVDVGQQHQLAVEGLGVGLRWRAGRVVLSLHLGHRASPPAFRRIAPDPECARAAWPNMTQH